MKIDPTTPEGKLDFIRNRLGMIRPWDGGISVTPKQENWFRDPKSLINIYHSGNQGGKSVTIGLDHLTENIVKTILVQQGVAPKIWRRTRYETLVFAPTYEVARGVFNICQDILAGSFVIRNPDNPSEFVFNQPDLEGLEVETIQRPTPEIRFPEINSHLFFRSADDMGRAFKMRKLAMVSGDEVGEIEDLANLIDITLLPRVAFWGGRINLLGTPQDLLDLLDLIEKRKRGDKAYTVMHGSMWDNIFIPREQISAIEATLDPEARKRVIWGEFVEIGSRFFRPSAITRTFSHPKMPKASGWIENPVAEGFYAVTGDFSAGRDKSVFWVFRYDQFMKKGTERQPIYPIYHTQFEGRTMGIFDQYELLNKIYNQVNDVGKNTKLIIDATSLGGKNAEEALQHNDPFPFHNISGHKKIRADALGAVAQFMEMGRQDFTGEDSEWRDQKDENWGMLRLPNIPEVRREWNFYRQDRKNLKDDNLMSCAMGIWWIKFRSPYKTRFKVHDLDPLGF